MDPTVYLTMSLSELERRKTNEKFLIDRWSSTLDFVRDIMLNPESGQKAIERLENCIEKSKLTIQLIDLAIRMQTNV